MKLSIKIFLEIICITSHALINTVNPLIQLDKDLQKIAQHAHSKRHLPVKNTPEYEEIIQQVIQDKDSFESILQTYDLMDSFWQQLLPPDKRGASDITPHKRTFFHLVAQYGGFAQLIKDTLNHVINFPNPKGNDYPDITINTPYIGKTALEIAGEHADLDTFATFLENKDLNKNDNTFYKVLLACIKSTSMTDNRWDPLKFENAVTLLLRTFPSDVVNYKLPKVKSRGTLIPLIYIEPIMFTLIDALPINDAVLMQGMQKFFENPNLDIQQKNYQSSPESEQRAQNILSYAIDKNKNKIIESLLKRQDINKILTQETQEKLEKYQTQH
jgi:hypothetical protein